MRYKCNCRAAAASLRSCDGDGDGDAGVRARQVVRMRRLRFLRHAVTGPLRVEFTRFSS